jgi:hypothetical protein
MLADSGRILFKNAGSVTCSKSYFIFVCYSMIENPYRQPFENSSPAGYEVRPRKKHGILGILAFAAAILGGFVTVSSLATIVIMVADGDMPEDSAQAVVAGLAVLLGLGIHFAGTILGLVGLFMAGSKKLFAIIGLILNTIALLVVLGLLVIGLAAG